MGLLEAMGQGVPGVASAVGGVPDVVDDGRTGLLVPVDDAAALTAAMAQLLADPDRRAAMGEAARQAVRMRHSPAALGDALQRLYGDCLGNPWPEVAGSR